MDSQPTKNEGNPLPYAEGDIEELLWMCLECTDDGPS